MSALDPRAWMIGIAVVVAVGSGGYFIGRSDGRALERDAAAKEAKDWRTNADAAYALYLEARDKKQTEYRTITKTVEVAKHATPDIPDCRTGDDWLRIFRENAAIANGAAVPAGSGSSDGTDPR
ncbi:hypothetical protein [Cupriavidus gilardii]|uniref:hypothetical protein n=1 Tax=Cupriavidus gilardii TaxID=82541 RepID=UPI0021B3DE71|nr:hypothetical protein [Cupriavidus gilardii]UXC37363.1 hypothetical protein N4G38_07975 [Cupriavidus gilardii]